jgi:hypothetical protein
MMLACPALNHVMQLRDNLARLIEFRLVDLTPDKPLFQNL